MTLISPDEMVLIGPGSEWFWIALQFCALAVTFVAIYRQLKAQHRHLQENTKLLRSQAHHNALMLSQRARDSAPRVGDAPAAEQASSRAS